MRLDGVMDERLARDVSYWGAHFAGEKLGREDADEVKGLVFDIIYSSLVAYLERVSQERGGIEPSEN